MGVPLLMKMISIAADFSLHPKNHPGVKWHSPLPFQESGVAKSGRYYLMCEHQCSGCGRCFNAASSIHLHSPCHLVNLGHLDACSGLDADQRPGAPVRSDYHFLRTAFGGGVSTKDLTWSDLEWTVSVKLCTREILSTS